MTRRVLVPLVLCLFVALPCAAAQAEGTFGLAPGATFAHAEERDGTADTQAGSHPYDFTFGFKLNEESSGHSAGGELRGFNVDLPPGLIGNPTVLPTCSRQSFE